MPYIGTYIYIYVMYVVICKNIYNFPVGKARAKTLIKVKRFLPHVIRSLILPLQNDNKVHHCEDFSTYL